MSINGPEPAETGRGAGRSDGLLYGTRATEVRRRRRGLLPPAMVAVGFAAAIGIGTLLLMLPMARESGANPRLIDTAFTATSAVTVTGLVTVDPGTTWSAFGEAVILGLIQIGGLGMVTSGTLLMLIVSRRLGLSTRLATQAETPGLSLGDVRDVLMFALRFVLTVELVLGALLSAVFAIRYDEALPRALWLGVFHSVSAFNNAGFSLFPDSLIGFQHDPFVLGVIMIAIVLGGLGLPVYIDINRHGWRQPRRWSVHSRLTVATTLVLLLLGTVLFTAFEWSNPSTHAGSSLGNGVLNGAFASVTARTAGFNAIDYGAATEETVVLTCFLMIIGGGSASTAGGIKVTTFIVLMLVVWAEARGYRDVNVGDRRLPSRTLRTALAITCSYAFLVGFGVLYLLVFSTHTFLEVAFEAVSAIATTGLSTGITPSLERPDLIMLMFLMFVGRLGAITLASAFALRRRTETYRLPDGSPIIG